MPEPFSYLRTLAGVGSVVTSLAGLFGGRPLHSVRGVAMTNLFLYLAFAGAAYAIEKRRRTPPGGVRPRH